MRNRTVLISGTILFFLALNPSSGQEKTKIRIKPQAPAAIELPFPMGGVAEGPETTASKKDLSMHGPGGSHFIYLEDKNLEPKETVESMVARIPGPGEPGFICEEQPNLYPGEPNREKKPILKEQKPKK
jgi:hypothetical protein